MTYNKSILTILEDNMVNIPPEEVQLVRRMQKEGRITHNCIDCNRELTENDPTPICVGCDHVYGDAETDLVESYKDQMEEMLYE